ncbi:MAG: HEPN domain-containing protein [Janthinobacterium lividum]
MIDCKYPFERGELNKSAFYLHQATESFYNTILLVFSNYKPKLHDIKKLGSKAENYSSELLQVFPIVTPEQKECFELLKKAYVDARYDKNYKITKKQLLYLIERIEKLKEITERICIARISR